MNWYDWFIRIENISIYRCTICVLFNSWHKCFCTVHTHITLWCASVKPFNKCIVQLCSRMMCENSCSMWMGRREREDGSNVSNYGNRFVSWMEDSQIHYHSHIKGKIKWCIVTLDLHLCNFCPKRHTREKRPEYKKLCLFWS